MALTDKEKIEKVLEIVESIQRDDGMEYGLPTVVKEKLKEITRVLTSQAYQKTTSIQEQINLKKMVFRHAFWIYKIKFTKFGVM